MKLIDIVANIEQFDDELIIFQKNENFDDDVLLLSYDEAGGNMKFVKDGCEFCYLIEMFLAKEFVEDVREFLKKNCDKVDDEEVAKRLHHYAVFDD